MENFNDVQNFGQGIPTERYLDLACIMTDDDLRKRVRNDKSVEENWADCKLPINSNEKEVLNKARKKKRKLYFDLADPSLTQDQANIKRKQIKKIDEGIQKFVKIIYHEKTDNEDNYMVRKDKDKISKLESLISQSCLTHTQREKILDEIQRLREVDYKKLGEYMNLITNTIKNSDQMNSSRKAKLKYELLNLIESGKRNRMQSIRIKIINSPLSEQDRNLLIDTVKQLNEQRLMPIFNIKY